MKNRKNDLMMMLSVFHVQIEILVKKRNFGQKTKFWGKKINFGQKKNRNYGPESKI